MNIAVIGAAGGVGRQVVQRLMEAGHTAQALIRKPEQATLPELQGAHTVIGDLTGDWQPVLDGAEAVVWAAGAGASGQFQAIDGDALIRVSDHLTAHGPRRLIVVSSMGVDRPDQMPPFLNAVLKVKAVSDAHVQGSGLDFTILRPGGLSDEPGSGQVTLARQVPSGMVPRQDVARVVLACLNYPKTIGQTFEIVSGAQSIETALAALH